MKARNFSSIAVIVLLITGFVMPHHANAQVTISIFSDSTLTNSFNKVRSVFAIDLDGDLDIDVLGSSPVMNNSEIRWYENKGSEGFIEHTIPVSASGIQSIYAVDIDGDLDIDIVTASTFDRKIAWYENDSNEGFTAHIISDSSNATYSIYAKDVDGDGDMDVLSASYNDQKIAWYENNGDPDSLGFTEHIVTVAAAGASSVYAADVNGDGHMDVLSASYSGNTIAWYENDGNEGFTGHDITTSAYGASSVYAVDVDGDGNMDVLSASVDDDKVAWYENDGNEVFTTHIISDSADGARSVYAIDLDGDMDIDVLNASSNDNTIAWYENDGNEGFTAHIISDSSNATYSIYAADIDGDDKVDVLGASISNNKITWYKNESHTFAGFGTSESPFQISSPEDLYHVRFALTSPFLVTNDIDLNVAPYNTGAGWEPIGKNSSGNEFQGVFDGNSFTIKNLFINRPTTDNVGLFVVNLGVIKNLALEEVDLTAANYSGTLVGRNYSEVLNSYATGTLSATNFSGGLVGYNENYLTSTAQIANSFSLVNVTSSNQTSGGLLGWLASGEVNTSYAAGSVPGSNGGLIWFSPGGTVTDSYWDTETTGHTTSAGGTGLTTAQMQQSANFIGFDFTTHWSSMDGAGYPHLQLFGYKKTMIHGDEGWRMFTAPSSALSYGELLDRLWTHGFTGADNSSSGISNVLTWNESTQTWSIPLTANEKPASGTGFIVYVFSDDNGPDVAGDAGFPKVHTHSYSQFTGSVAPTLSYTDSGSPADDGWNLVGNPYGTTIDWDGPNGWGRSNLDTTFYVWSDSAGGGAGAYLTWNGFVGTLGHGKIAPWQGFWVKAYATGPGMSLNDSVKSTGATFHKQAPIPHIKLSLEDGEKRSKAVVMFHEQAKSGKDGLDGYKLASLNMDYLLLGTSLPDGESMDIQALPLDSSEYQLELVIEGSNLNGEFTLSWSEIAIPDDWEIMLIDRAEGTEIPVKDRSSVHFRLHEKKNAVQKEEVGLPASPVQLLKRTKGVASRFELRIKQGITVSTEPGAMLPASVELQQNYPNPFNPSTTIEFGVPTQSDVHLEVFDLLGRRVAELLNEPKNAGRYSINFDASRLASGLYIYRLQVGTKVLTKKMTLIK